MKLRPENIWEFDEEYLRDMKTRCNIMLQEAIRSDDMSRADSVSSDIEKIDRELSSRDFAESMLSLFEDEESSH